MTSQSLLMMKQGMRESRESDVFLINTDGHCKKHHSTQQQYFNLGNYLTIIDQGFSLGIDQLDEKNYFENTQNQLLRLTSTELEKQKRISQLQ